jgi:4a-hydroxytetrahydrobiopterin dehydratase
MALGDKKCVPCEGGITAMEMGKAEKMLEEVPGWNLTEENVLKIEKIFKFKDFKQNMKFVNKVADIAENEGHHPNFMINWNKTTLTLWTHSISGLSENDFIMAAKINNLSR